MEKIQSKTCCNLCIYQISASKQFEKRISCFIKQLIFSPPPPIWLFLYRLSSFPLVPPLHPLYFCHIKIKYLYINIESIQHTILTTWIPKLLFTPPPQKQTNYPGQILPRETQLWKSFKVIKLTFILLFFRLNPSEIQTTSPTYYPH